MKLTRQPSHFFLFLSIIFPRTEKITKKRDHLLVSFFHFTKSLVRSFVRLLRIPLLLLHLFPLEWIEKRRERDRERPLIRFLGPARANQTKTRGRGLRSLAPGNTSRQGTFIQMHSARAFITLFGQKQKRIERERERRIKGTKKKLTSQIMKGAVREGGSHSFSFEFKHQFVSLKID